MPDAIEAAFINSDPEFLRESIRGSLVQITDDIRGAMLDAGLGNIPTYLVVPNSGDAIATVATPLDPSDYDWTCVLEIACRVIKQRTDSGNLRHRALDCSAINMGITVADLMTDPVTETFASSESSAAASQV